MNTDGERVTCRARTGLRGRGRRRSNAVPRGDGPRAEGTTPPPVWQRPTSHGTLVGARVGVRMADRPIRLANLSGHFGDRFIAGDEVLAGDPVDVPVGDYPAEIALAAPAAPYPKDPVAGMSNTSPTRGDRIWGRSPSEGSRSSPTRCVRRGHRPIPHDPRPVRIRPRRMAARMREAVGPQQPGLERISCCA
ncbi:acyclic terpene utilization AtuA family protein [Nocardia brevicatena]|uniref:acyclic terpene utilization AtuA family protein n=1 Tax=Nocardia brevicatena TaxID=37327 RepID=UPI003F687E9E